MSPVVLDPVSTAYCSLSRAPPPPSVIYQPVGNAVLVVLPAVFESVSKFSVAAVPRAASETLPVPVSARTDLKSIRFRYDRVGKTNAKHSSRNSNIQFREREEPCLRKGDIMDCNLSSVFHTDCGSALRQRGSLNEAERVKISSRKRSEKEFSRT